MSALKVPDVVLDIEQGNLKDDFQKKRVNKESKSIHWLVGKLLDYCPTFLELYHVLTGVLSPTHDVFLPTTGIGSGEGTVTDGRTRE